MPRPKKNEAKNISVVSLSDDSVNQETKKTLTLKDKISNIIDKYEDKSELKKAVFDLIQRVLYPEQFCPECDDRLFLNGNKYNCLNCGYSRDFSPPQTTIVTRVQTEKTVKPQTGKVPEQVEKAIAQANENIRTVVPSSRGEQIRKLADQLGDSHVAPTPHDTDVLKGADPNVRDVNWV
jgi:DNA-directed RNA polymerase subunit M/transcription elongation factor TFIIS